MEAYRRIVKNRKLKKAFEAKVKDLKSQIRVKSRFNPKTNDLECVVSIVKARKKDLKSK